MISGRDSEGKFYQAVSVSTSWQKQVHSNYCIINKPNASSFWLVVLASEIQSNTAYNIIIAAPIVLSLLVIKCWGADREELQESETTFLFCLPLSLILRYNIPTMYIKFEFCANVGCFMNNCSLKNMFVSLRTLKNIYDTLIFHVFDYSAHQILQLLIIKKSLHDNNIISECT